jgi:hypothetical protein
MSYSFPLVERAVIIVLQQDLMTFIEICALALTNKTLFDYIFVSCPTNQVMRFIFERNMRARIKRDFGLSMCTFDMLLTRYNAFATGGSVLSTLQGRGYEYKTITYELLDENTMETGIDLVKPDLDIFFLTQKDLVGMKIWLIKRCGFEVTTGNSEDYDCDGDYNNNTNLLQSRRSHYQNRIVDCFYLKHKSPEIHHINLIFATNSNHTVANPRSIVSKFDLSIISNYYRPNELYIGCPVDIAEHRWTRNHFTMFDEFGKLSRTKRIRKYIDRGFNEQNNSTNAFFNRVKDFFGPVRDTAPFPFVPRRIRSTSSTSPTTSSGLISDGRSTSNEIRVSGRSTIVRRRSTSTSTASSGRNDGGLISASSSTASDAIGGGGISGKSNTKGIGIDTFSRRRRR